MLRTGQTEVMGENTLSATPSTKNLTQTDSGLNPGLRGDRPVAYRLSHSNFKRNTINCFEEFSSYRAVNTSRTGCNNQPSTNTYSLTYSMVQSPSWEANWFAAIQEIPRISRNPKVHYRTHKRPPTVYILGQPNPVHIPTSHLLEIHPNIIHPSTSRSPQWSTSLQFPHQVPTHHPLLNHTRHMPSPSHSSLFYHPHNIGWAVQII